MSDPTTRAKAWPLAPAELNDQVCFSSFDPQKRTMLTCTPTTVPKILDLVEKASQYKQLKKGANEGACVAV